MSWLTRAGEHAQILHDRSFCHLHLPHLQLDELRTRLRSSTRVLWLWLAIDPFSKLLPVLHVGPRTQLSAHTVIHSLRQTLAPGCVPLFTSDGLNLYFYALTAHFGQWLQVRHRGRKVSQWQVAAGLLYGHRLVVRPPSDFSAVASSPKRLQEGLGSVLSPSSVVDTQELFIKSSSIERSLVCSVTM